MARPLFSAIAALALALFAPTTANAVSFAVGGYNFDFSQTLTSGPNRGAFRWLVGETAGDVNTNRGNSMTFRSIESGQVQVKVTGWSIDRGTSSANTSTDIVTKATLRLWDGGSDPTQGGLGVQNMYEANQSPNHSIDNGYDSSNGATKYMVDFVMLQFDYITDVTSMKTGWVSTDSDATVRVGPGQKNWGDWNSPLALNGKNVFGSTGNTELNDYVEMANTQLLPMNPMGSSSSAGQYRNIDAGDKRGMIWLIGALYGTDNNDYFKLDALNMTIFPTVPEPSTWMTMILGFGFIGASMRRRKASFAKDALPAA